MIQKRMPGLDGVRGLAILLVFAYHSLRGVPIGTTGEQWVQRLASTGWVGVDLFFVLSGFLITGILLDTRGNAGYFRTFYARRVLRILPLYLAFVAVLLYVFPQLPLMTPAQAEGLQQSRIWYWTHSVNFMIARNGWEHGTWHSGHLWSLSLEEQFYLCWPAVVFLLTPRRLLPVTAAIILGGWLLRMALVPLGVSWTTIYVLLPTRMDALATGALLAALARERREWFRLRLWIAPAACAACVLLVLFRREGLLRSGALTQTVGYPALAILASAAIVHAVTAPAGSLAAGFWSNGILRFFGRYSYGLYVWHVPLIAIVSDHLLDPDSVHPIGGSHLPGYLLFALVALACSTGVALISWHAIESPFLSLKIRVPYTDKAAVGGGEAGAILSRVPAP